VAAPEHLRQAPIEKFRVGDTIRVEVPAQNPDGSWIPPSDLVQAEFGMAGPDGAKVVGTVTLTNGNQPILRCVVADTVSATLAATRYGWHCRIREPDGHRTTLAYGDIILGASAF
jgi:hypothetical protein